MFEVSIIGYVVELVKGLTYNMHHDQPCEFRASLGNPTQMDSKGGLNW